MQDIEKQAEIAAAKYKEAIKQTVRPPLTEELQELQATNPQEFALRYATLVEQEAQKQAEQYKQSLIEALKQQIPQQPPQEPQQNEDNKTPQTQQQTPPPQPKTDTYTKDEDFLIPQPLDAIYLNDDELEAIKRQVGDDVDLTEYF